MKKLDFWPLWTGLMLMSGPLGASENWEDPIRWDGEPETNLIQGEPQPDDAEYQLDSCREGNIVDRYDCRHQNAKIEHERTYQIALQQCQGDPRCVERVLSERRQEEKDDNNRRIGYAATALGGLLAILGGTINF